MTQPFHPPATTGAEARLAARSGRLDRHTSGQALGHVQGNVVILPAGLATDFMRYCQRNPKPCPLLAVSDAGDPSLATLGEGIDIRTDLPRYRVWREGALVDEPTDIRALWQDDFVTFVIGCSFSFEEALMADGIRLRHIELQRNVAMYRTTIATEPAGPFSGPMVVSMRPMSAADAIRAVQITSRLPTVHGAPVHIGDPAQIGIADLSKPDYGDAVEVRAGELPVFWACGVTPQAALVQARVPLAITHAPGAMLVTDLLNRHLAAF
ncbi:putative hydro-lyase [Piscinibacter gummiphilus]|uniref:Putative hydro-lyase RXV79_02555 n=1 Tax=Piscinibacter gummiphilus TaxID=946333 RepID=A0ABZ0CVE8_9BURK|nr:putative hydro-lyase [Piscinibacter gummiphilus]WOB08949.1 putative hydro-lyase [Piscinibacter gummiphilus]